MVHWTQRVRAEIVTHPADLVIQPAHLPHAFSLLPELLPGRSLTFSNARLVAADYASWSCGLSNEYLAVRKNPRGFRHLLAAHLPDLSILGGANNDSVLSACLSDDSCRLLDEFNVFIPELQLQIRVLVCL